MSERQQNFTKTIVIRVAPDTHEDLDRLGRELDRPVAWIVRRALNEYLDRHLDEYAARTPDF